jgi:hypothetical protein
VPEPRRKASVVVVNDIMYILGGLAYGGKPSCSVWAYKAKTDQWFSMKCMPESYSDATCAALDDEIFVVRVKSVGYYYDPHAEKVMIYNCVNNEWTLGSPSIFVHSRGVAIATDFRIIVFGGKDSDLIEEYCPFGRMWSRWNLKVVNPGTFSSAFLL